MPVLRENLTMDLFYASTTTTEGVSTLKLTAVVRDSISNTEVHTSTMLRTGEEGTGTYGIAFQSIADASDPVQVQLESYFRGVNQELFETLLAKVKELFTTNLNPNTTWMGTYGLRIGTSVAIDSIVPESAFA